MFKMLNGSRHPVGELMQASRFRRDIEQDGCKGSLPDIVCRSMGTEDSRDGNSAFAERSLQCKKACRPISEIEEVRHRLSGGLGQCHSESSSRFPAQAQFRHAGAAPCDGVEPPSQDG